MTSLCLFLPVNVSSFIHEEIILLAFSMFSKETLLAIAFLLIISNFIHCNVQDMGNRGMRLFDLNWKFNYRHNIL